MPLYEYQCDACGAVFEKMQKFSDEPFTVHEVCGGAVRRLLSPPALQFKGSGWYITDYARGGSKAKDPGSKGTAESAKKADSASTDSAKPAAATTSSSTSDSK